jgi:hypothetical protein
MLEYHRSDGQYLPSYRSGVKKLRRGSKSFAEAPRASPLSSFQPLRAGHACRSRAFACSFANVRMDFFLLTTLCALQMEKLQQKNVSKATLAATAKREAKRTNFTAEASSGAAPVDSGTDPPPAGRFRRSCRTPITQVRSNRPLRLLPLLRTLQPQQSYHSESGGNAEHPPLPTYVSSYLPVEATALLMHAPMRRAVTRAATALRYTALRCAAVRWKALCCDALRCTALALHRAAHWQLSPSSTPTARVRTLRCGAGWSCGSDGDRRVLRDDDAAFVEPGS